MTPHNFAAFTMKAWGKQVRNDEHHPGDGLHRTVFDIDGDKMEMTVRRIGNADPIPEEEGE